MATTKTKPKPKPSRNGPPAPAPEVMTLAEAAAYLRTTETAVLTEVRAGRLGGRQIGGEWRFWVEALFRWRFDLGEPSWLLAPEDQLALRALLEEYHAENERLWEANPPPLGD